MALHQVPAHQRAQAKGTLEVHAMPDVEIAQRRPGQRLGPEVERRPDLGQRSTTVRHAPFTAMLAPSTASGRMTRALHARGARPRGSTTLAHFFDQAP